MATPMRTQIKRFRSGYACSELRAKQWIREQIQIYRDYQEECKAEGKETLEGLFFVNGTLTH